MTIASFLSMAAVVLLCFVHSDVLRLRRDMDKLMKHLNIEKGEE